MEARLLAALALVLLIRLPFLSQPIQGDDVYYLAIARNALVDPLHPMQMGYTFQGDRVSMAGHPHPPLNAYILALLLRFFGGVRETAFHAVYMIFSLIAAAAVWRLARRFTEHPLLATTLFLAVPAFVVNGNSLESDLPFLAFWLAGFAFYFDGRHRLAALALALSALAAYQAVFAAPILAYHTWHNRRRSKTAWAAVAAAPLALASWQGFQILSAGELPAGVLAGYLHAYGLLAVVKKLRSALALAAHLGWIVFPLAVVGRPPAAIFLAAAGIAMVLPGHAWWQQLLLAVSLAAGLMVLWRWARSLRAGGAGDAGFLAAWGLTFFAGAALVFFAGSARYLLPLAAPVVFLAVRECRTPVFLWPAAAANLALGILMASANYHHWDGYRRFASRLAPLAAGESRIWTSAEWGLRYYLEQLGAEPLRRNQEVHAGSLVVRSRLAGDVPSSSGGGERREILRSEIRAARPIRIFGLGTRSGYSSSDLGVLPFDLGGGVLDEVSAEIVGLPRPKLSYLRMNDPEASAQLLSGFYALEQNTWRWMSEQAAALLKAPQGAARLEIRFFIPDAAPARRLTVAVDGVSVATRRYPGPGRYTLEAPAPVPKGEAVTVVIFVDRAFQPPGDQRRLGVIAEALGFR